MKRFEQLLGIGLLIAGAVGGADIARAGDQDLAGGWMTTVDGSKGAAVEASGKAGAKAKNLSATNEQDGAVATPVGIKAAEPGYERIRSMTLDEKRAREEALKRPVVSPQALDWKSPAASVAEKRSSRSRDENRTRTVYVNNQTGDGAFPPFSFPYAGYNNNPFTGLSSYSNGYAGAPPSTVPFAGGWFQGRSAYYSQPTMTVPSYPVVAPRIANPGPVGGGGRGKDWCGSVPSRNNNSNTNTNTNVNVQLQQGGAAPYYYY